MAKSSTEFLCQVCGYSSPKWLGQCPECHSWNTLVETVSAVSASASKKKGGVGGGRGATAATSTFADLQKGDTTVSRMSTGMAEFDRVLGGGIVPGAVILIGGEPGIGKSTLLTHLCLNLLKDSNKKDRILYLCGEENPQQIRLRIERILSVVESGTGSKGVSESRKSWADRLVFSQTTDIDEGIALVHQLKPSAVILDSVQTVQTSDLTGGAGSVGQLKECTLRATEAAKTLHIPFFLVGHVTKEGSIAGPKVLEHIVDSVLELTGERTGVFRLLRCLKNRFGPTDEVGIFETVEEGLREVANPSEVFLQDRRKGVAGSAVAPLLEGTRVVLVEVQSLVVDTQLAMPRRVGRGIALPRIQLLCAVLQKHCGLPLASRDVFVNVAGGFELDEPAADLAVAMAIASSCANVALPNDSVYAGEIGLLGEIRRVTMAEKRMKEAKALGYSTGVTGREHAFIRDLVKTITRKS